MKGHNFAIFIMVYGRPEKMWTTQSLRSHGYTGKIYYVADDTDETLEAYKEKYGDDLIVFDKSEAMKRVDSGDNSGDMRSTLYATSTIPILAKELGVDRFYIFCDDYISYWYKFGDNLCYVHNGRIKNLDGVFEAMVKFYDRVKPKTIAFAQGGDFMGGRDSEKAQNIRLYRKAMNTFLCGVENPIVFMGRLNEDVTTYTNLGMRGDLLFTTNQVSIIQNVTQKTEGGLTDVYLAYGTYIKSFFSVMYNPSCTRIRSMGVSSQRLHHHIKWSNAVPMIISEKYRKASA